MHQIDDSEQVSVEAAAFFEAARTGRFLLPKCEECGRFHWYPRAVCPFCLAGKIGWHESRGLGHVYTSTIFRRADVPLIIAYVELDEGPRILTKILTDSLRAVPIGQRVEVEFVSSEDKMDRPYLAFRPTDKR
ncbi:Zn-ribbon domain-containing OB-fold protein [Rhizobium ecuadorense]|uniref:Zn-ribbon domain-containing OB-fold protein n=1 Tax=Rhizobium ecuadorense TaxID=1671795 RepID=UPI0006737B4B|nr:OB-fold domain-containing protein [Rhizobium ecuadorense]